MWKDTKVTRIGVAVTYALIGVVLALNLDHALRNWFVGPERWHNSLYLPLWIACIVFAATAMVLELPVRSSAVYGALVTVPPYAWYLALSASDRMSGGGQDTELSGVLFVAGLGLSGVLLSPLLFAAVGRLKRRWAA